MVVGEYCTGVGVAMTGKRQTRIQRWNALDLQHRMVLVWNRHLLLVRDWREVLTRIDLGSSVLYPRRSAPRRPGRSRRRWLVWRNTTWSWHLIDLHLRLMLHQASEIVSKTVFYEQGVPLMILSVSLVGCMHLLRGRGH